MDATSGLSKAMRTSNRIRVPIGGVNSLPIKWY